MADHTSPFEAPNEKVHMRAMRTRNASRASFARLRKWGLIGTAAFLTLYLFQHDGGGYKEVESFVSAIVPPAAPVAAPAIERVFWDVGLVYPLAAGKVYEGVLPDAGVIFAQPAGLCVLAQAHDGQQAIYSPEGTQKVDPWGRVRATPRPEDRGKVFEVRAQCN
jgi:hypothetical protein